MKTKPLSFIILLIAVLIINTGTFVGGFRHHETWRILIGGVSIAFIMAAGIIKVIKGKKQKKNSLFDVFFSGYRLLAFCLA